MNVRDKFLKTLSLSSSLASSLQKCYDGLIASYNIATLIANAGKAYTIGEELTLPELREVLETV